MSTTAAQLNSTIRWFLWLQILFSFLHKTHQNEDKSLFARSSLFLFVIDSSSPHRATTSAAGPSGSPQVLIKSIKDAAHTHTHAHRSAWRVRVPGSLLKKKKRSKKIPTIPFTSRMASLAGERAATRRRRHALVCTPEISAAAHPASCLP